MVNILDPKVKRDLLTWFVKLQLSEYLVLFGENQDVSSSFLIIKIKKYFIEISHPLLLLAYEFEKKINMFFFFFEDTLHNYGSKLINRLSPPMKRAIFD